MACRHEWCWGHQDTERQGIAYVHCTDIVCSKRGKVFLPINTKNEIWKDRYGLPIVKNNCVWPMNAFRCNKCHLITTERPSGADLWLEEWVCLECLNDSPGTS